MTKRFFKLLYVLALIVIGLSLPVYLLLNIDPDAITRTSYKAKCLSNSQYVVLQGSQYNEVDVMDEFYLNSPENSTAIKKQLNFYCTYYDQIQPHIKAYVESKTLAEQRTANTNFWNFRDSVEGNVSAYPALYQLEVVSEIKQWNAIYNPIVEWVLLGGFSFLVLQIIRMCYIYVVFGKVVWHPFRKVETDI